MTIEVRVPQLPESVADATLVSWHKKPGDSVVRDENLVDLETDKVVLEVPAPVAGVLKEIRLSDGTTVTSGQILAIIEEGAAAVPGASAPAILAASSGATAAAKDTVAKGTVAKDSKPDAIKQDTAGALAPGTAAAPSSMMAKI
jgi:2-oxoglutarate dehydrogenase E2 component (dihydrolipoamide succinyltransferase)